MDYILKLRKSTDLLYQVHIYLMVLLLTVSGIAGVSLIFTKEPIKNGILLINLLVALTIGFAYRAYQYKNRYNTVVHVDTVIRNDGSYQKHKEYMLSDDHVELTTYYHQLILQEEEIRDGRNNQQLKYKERVYLTLIHYEKEHLKQKGVSYEE